MLPQLCQKQDIRKHRPFEAQRGQKNIRYKNLVVTNCMKIIKNGATCDQKKSGTSTNTNKW